MSKKYLVSLLSILIVTPVLVRAADISTPLCPLLTTFITIGGNNNSVEVTKLQTFLHDHEKADVEVTGQYDQKTIAAVKVFQVAHANVVLKPYGINFPTGNIFVTTQRELNQVACTPTAQIPASSAPVVITGKADLATPLQASIISRFISFIGQLFRK